MEIVFGRVGVQSKINSEDVISLEGSTTSQQTIAEYLWESSLDGELCRGSSCSILVTSTLSNGTHEIYFTVKGGNGLWSSAAIIDFEVNGRPVVGETVWGWIDEIARMEAASFTVDVSDDSTYPEDLDYSVGYRIKDSEDEWESAYIQDLAYNIVNEELEFTFAPDEYAPVGEYEFYIEATDEDGASLVAGGEDSYNVIEQTLVVKNNDPVIVDNNVPVQFAQGAPISFDIETSDEDGVISTVIWYADGKEIGTGANFSFEDNNLDPGEHTITVRVLDNEGGYSEQNFEVFVIEAAVEESAVDAILTDFSNNLPLIGLLAFGMIMVVECGIIET